jgi:hypothetical protein
MGRFMRPTFGLALLTALALTFTATAQAHHKERFVPFGTAKIAKDPTDSANQVLAITTQADEPTTPEDEALFGGITRDLNLKITALDDHLSVSYYFPFPRTCGGGSPRIQLRIDIDGNGTGDANLFGHIGPAPAFIGCPMNIWQHEDLTLTTLENAPQTVCRWDASQVVAGTQCITWDSLKTLISTGFPFHRILRGSLVDDTFVGSPSGEGTAFYDDVTIGYFTFYDSSDTIGN